MGEEKIETLLPMYLGLFGESQYTNSQEAQAWTQKLWIVLFWGMLFVVDLTRQMS